MSDPVPRWCVSVLVSRMKGGAEQVMHSAFMVEAMSVYEAQGKALAIARKGYPASEGWAGHHANVSPADNVIDPAGDVTVEDGP